MTLKMGWDRNPLIARVFGDENSPKSHFGFTLAEGATHVDSFANNRKFGFTLAEVLITLGIIGVVAAITIPTLVQNYRRHVVANKLKTDVSILQQALLRSIADNGTPDTWGIENNQSNTFEVYFKPYLKTIKTERMSYYVKTYGATDYKNVIHWAYTLNNGTIIMFRHGGTLSLSNRRGMFYIIVKNNNEKIYNYGKDIFTFNLIVNENDKRYYITSAADYPSQYNFFCQKSNTELKEACKVGFPSGRGYAEGIGCSALLECNGWEFPKDYPMKL